MPVNRWLAGSGLGLLAVGLVLATLPKTYGPRLERVSPSELDEVQGLSQWRVIYGTQSCNQYNTNAANTVGGIPGQPPGNIIPVESCVQNGQGPCLECDGTGSEFIGATQQGPGNGAVLTDLASVSCGNLYFGNCQPNGVGGFTCNNNGQPDAQCGDVTEFWTQRPAGQ